MAEQAASAALYRTLVVYLRNNGWTRQEEVSGWWWKPGCEEDATIGGALEQQLREDGIDTRVMIGGEPHEFWAAAGETPDA